MATDQALKKHKKVIHIGDAEPQIKRRRITRENETLPEETLGKIKVSSQEEAKLKTIELIEIVNDGFKCSYCGHISKRKDNMESHIEIHFDGLQYPCKSCDKVFPRKNSLSSHKSMLHRGF